MKNWCTNKKEKFTFVVNRQDFLRWIKEVGERVIKGYDWDSSMVIRSSKNSNTDYLFTLDYDGKLVFTIEKRQLIPLWDVENQKSDVSDPENGGEGQNSSQNI